MAHSNYKVYADISTDRHLLSRILTVLDIGAGANFIRHTELPPGAKLHQGPLPDICDGNNRPIAMASSVELVVQLGSCVVNSDVIVRERLAGPLILGCDFCDRFVEEFNPCKKTVELDDGATVSITRRTMKRASDAVPLPPS